MMSLKKYFYVGHFPVWELIATALITLSTVYLGRIVTDKASVFNFVPFIIVSFMCWGYVIFKIYVFVRVYFEDVVMEGEVLSVKEDFVKIGFLDIVNNKIIVVVGVGGKFRKQLATDMPVHFKIHGRWIEILETNEYYGAYKKSLYFEDYDLLGRLMMKVFTFLDKQRLV